MRGGLETGSQADRIPGNQRRYRISEVGRAEWLRQKAVGTAIGGGFLHRGLGVGRQDYDLDVRSSTVASQLGEHLPAVDAGQSDVERDHVGNVVASHGEPALAIESEVKVEPHRRQSRPQQVLHYWGVLDDEDGGSGIHNDVVGAGAIPLRAVEATRVVTS